MIMNNPSPDAANALIMNSPHPELASPAAPPQAPQRKNVILGSVADIASQQDQEQVNRINPEEIQSMIFETVNHTLNGIVPESPKRLELADVVAAINKADEKEAEEAEAEADDKLAER